MKNYLREPDSKGYWKIKAKLPHCQLWENSTMRMTAEAYPVSNYHRSHARINRNKPHVVNSFGCCFDSKTEQCYLLIEPIPSRLSHLSQISTNQLLRVMEGALKGLAELEETYGYVGLTQDCICFTQDGNVKVWVNPDLSSLHPIILVQQRGFSTISYIIIELCSILSRKCNKCLVLEVFIQKLNRNRIYSFTQATQQLKRIDQELKMKQNIKQVLPISHNFNNQNYHQTLQDKQSMIPQRRTKKNLTEISHNFTKPAISGHHRNMSFHQKTQTLKHQRSHSQLDSEMIRNRRNIAHEQGKLGKFCPHLNKSASTVKEGFLQFKKNSSTFQQNFDKKMNTIQQISEKITSTNSTKDIQQEKNTKFIKPSIVKTSICPYFNEDLGDGKETQISGEFKTFGILEQTLEKKMKVKNDEKLIAEPQNIFDDLDISALDRQIQRRINHKQKQKKQKDIVQQNDSGNEILKTFLQNRLQVPPKEQIQTKTKKQGIYSKTLNPYTESIQKRQKYQNFDSIEEKYEKYIKGKITKTDKYEQKHQAKPLRNANNNQNILMLHTKSISLYSNKADSASNKVLSSKYNPIRIS